MPVRSLVPRNVEVRCTGQPIRTSHCSWRKVLKRTNKCLRKAQLGRKTRTSYSASKLSTTFTNGSKPDKEKNQKVKFWVLSNLCCSIQKSKQQENMQRDESTFCKLNGKCRKWQLKLEMKMNEQFDCAAVLLAKFNIKSLTTFLAKRTLHQPTSTTIIKQKARISEGTNFYLRWCSVQVFSLCQIPHTQVRILLFACVHLVNLEEKRWRTRDAVFQGVQIAEVEPVDRLTSLVNCDDQITPAITHLCWPATELW